MLLRRLQSALDQIDLLPRRRDTSLGLLLKYMQNVDGSLEPDRVHRPVGVAVVT